MPMACVITTRRCWYTSPTVNDYGMRYYEYPPSPSPPDPAGALPHLPRSSDKRSQHADVVVSEGCRSSRNGLLLPPPGIPKSRGRPRSPEKRKKKSPDVSRESNKEKHENTDNMMTTTGWPIVTRCGPLPHASET